MPSSYELQIAIPPSKKNSQNIVAFGKACPHCGKKPHRKVLPSREAREAERRIRAQAEILFRHPTVPLLGNDDVSLSVHVHALSNRCDVRVTSLGPPPDGPTGRTRDLHNVPDALCDALNGVLYHDDRQVRRVVLLRTVD